MSGIPKDNIPFRNQIGKGKITLPNYSPFKLSSKLEENYFTLEIFNTKSFHKSEAAQELTYRAAMKNPNTALNLADLQPHLEALFSTLLTNLRKSYENGSIARLYIDHPNLEKAIIVVPTPLSKLTPTLILDHIDNAVNSAGEIPADEALEINVAVIKTLQGNGRKHVFNTEDLKNKKSIVEIKNDDNNCLARAIVV